MYKTSESIVIMKHPNLRRFVASLTLTTARCNTITLECTEHTGSLSSGLNLYAW